MKKKPSKIEFKLDEKLFINYKSFCEKNGYDFSKRLRLFIQYELLYDLNNQNAIKELENKSK